VCKFKYASCNYFTRYVNPYEGYIHKQHTARFHWLLAAVVLKGVCLWLLLLHTADVSSRGAIWALWLITILDHRWRQQRKWRKVGIEDARSPQRRQRGDVSCFWCRIRFPFVFPSSFPSHSTSPCRWHFRLFVFAIQSSILAFNISVRLSCSLSLPSFRLWHRLVRRSGPLW